MRNEPARSRQSVRALPFAGVGLGVLGLCGLASLVSAGGGPNAAAPLTIRREPLRELGRRLFFDAAATSRMGMRACADCHDPGHGFADRETTSADDTAPTKRHSQTLVDGAANPSGHWDGEFKKIEDLVRARLSVRFDSGEARYGSGSPDEADADGPLLQSGVRGVLDLSSSRAGSFTAARSSRAVGGVDPTETAPIVDDAETQLEAPAAVVGAVDVMPATPSAEEVFGVKDGAPEPRPGFVNVSRTRSGERSPLPVASAIVASSGRYREAFAAAFGSEDVSATRIARAVAEYCHSIRSGDSAYDRHVAGEEGALAPDARRGLELFQGEAGCASCHTLHGSRAAFTDYDFHNTGVSWHADETAKAVAKAAGRPSNQARADGPDEGRAIRTGNRADARKFKTPTLRDVARHAPYMHDGSLATLEDVVRYYAHPGADGPKDPTLDAKFPQFNPSEAEIADLVAFLRSLSSERRPGLAASPWRERATRTRLEFVDADARPLAGLQVALVPAGDVLPGFLRGDEAARVDTTGSDGAVEFIPPRATHTRILLADGLRPAGGDLVPDTCRSVRVVVPVRGRATLTVTFAKGASTPDVLVVRHPDATVFPGRRIPTTPLRRTTAETAADGTVTAEYDAPYRTDVGPAGDLQLPAPLLGMSSLRVFLDPTATTKLRLVETK